MTAPPAANCLERLRAWLGSVSPRLENIRKGRTGAAIRICASGSDSFSSTRLRASVSPVRHDGIHRRSGTARSRNSALRAGCPAVPNEPGITAPFQTEVRRISGQQNTLLERQPDARDAMITASGGAWTGASVRFLSLYRWDNITYTPVRVVADPSPFATRLAALFRNPLTTKTPSLKSRIMAGLSAAALISGTAGTEAASVWISIEGTIEKSQFFIGDTFSEPTEVDAPIPTGTKWKLSGWVGERASSAHPYGVDMLGQIMLGDSFYVDLSAGQVEFDHGDGDHPNEWSISVENESPDNPGGHHLPDGYSFNELLCSIVPWWQDTDVPPPGVWSPATGVENLPPFWIILEQSGGFLKLTGSATTVTTSIPETDSLVLIAVAGVFLLRRARRCGNGDYPPA